MFGGRKRTCRRGGWVDLHVPAGGGRRKTRVRGRRGGTGLVAELLTLYGGRSKTCRRKTGRRGGGVMGAMHHNLRR